METLDFSSMQELNEMIEGIDNDAKNIITHGYDQCMGTINVSDKHCVINITLDKPHKFDMSEHALMYKDKVIVIQKLWMGHSLIVMLERFS